MNILAINTTNKLAEVVCSGNNKIGLSKINGAFSEHIMGAVTNSLNSAKLNINNIDTIGVVVGPGSFTGIRIGIAVVKGIVCALNQKCVAVNSFELISYNINSNNFIVLLDSGNSEPYYAIFNNGQISEMGYSSLDKLVSYSKQNNLQMYCSSAEKHLFNDKVISVDIDDNTLINLITEKAKQNSFVSIQQISPVYIKASQAEIGLEQKIKDNVSYRIANKNDASMLALIDEQCFSGHELYTEQVFIDELNLQDRHYIVATYGSLVIGYVGLWKTGDDLNLLKIAVLPQYRSLGIGFKLMQMVLDYRKQEKLNQLFLEVRENNEKAIKLYKKFGFKTANVREKYYDDGENCLVMFAK